MLHTLLEYKIHNFSYLLPAKAVFEIVTKDTWYTSSNRYSTSSAKSASRVPTLWVSYSLLDCACGLGLCEDRHSPIGSVPLNTTSKERRNVRCIRPVGVSTSNPRLSCLAQNTMDLGRRFAKSRFTYLAVSYLRAT